MEVEAKKVIACRWTCPKCIVINYEPLDDMIIGENVLCGNCKGQFKLNDII